MRRKIWTVLALAFSLAAGGICSGAEELVDFETIDFEDAESEAIEAEETEAEAAEVSGPEEEAVVTGEAADPQEVCGWILHVPEEDLFTDGEEETEEITLPARPHGFPVMFGDSEKGGFQLYEDGYLLMFHEGTLTRAMMSFFVEDEYLDTPITWVELAGPITEIEAEAFRDMTSLRVVDMSAAKVSRIGSGAFRFCESLETVTFSEELTELGYRAFSECGSLSSLQLPEGTRSVGPCAFYDCFNLKEVNLPAALEEIPYGLFDGCASLEALTIPAGVTRVDYEAFRGCLKLQDLTFEKGITDLGFDAFKGCSALKDIRLAEGLSEIPRGAFEGCSSLTQVTLPDTVTRIGARAFYNCPLLKEIRVQAGRVEKVGSLAFGYMDGKKQSVRVEGVTLWGRGCDALEAYAMKKKLTFAETEPLGLQVPKLLKAVNTAQGIEITWEPVEGAEQYRVFRRTPSGGFSALADVKTPSWIDTEAVNGSSFFYTVRCIRADGDGNCSGYDPEGIGTVCLQQPVMTRWKNRGEGEAALWWEANPQADGYRVRCVVNGEKKLHRIPRNDKIFYAFKKLPKDASCRLSVQACKEVEGKHIYSAWSKAKTVVIAK